MTIADYSENSYFAAANSRDGFISFFDKIFSPEELDFLYIIKGGSGCGKSSLMREVALEAKKRGERVEYFYCSSDPKSLDGIILTERKIGIIDGTSPHVCEPSLPGCFDEIINLGAFWNNRILRERRDEICELIKEKKRLYKSAYSYLSVSGKLEAIRDSILSGGIKSEKLNLWAERFCKRFLYSENPCERIRLTQTVSSLGRINLDSFYLGADTHFVVKDPFRISHVVFDAIINAARFRGIGMVISYDPIDTKKVNGLYFTNSKVSVTLAKEHGPVYDDLIINTERFFERDIYKEIRQRARYIGKCADIMCTCAIDTMKNITALHRGLEDIYISAMNFDAKEEYTKELIKKIFD